MWIGEERKKEETRKILQNEVKVHFLLFLSDGKRQIRGEKEWKSHTIYDYWYLTIWYYLTLHFRQLKERSKRQQRENWMKMKWKLLLFSPHHREWCDSIGILKKRLMQFHHTLHKTKLSPATWSNQYIQHSRVYMSEKRHKVEGYKLFAKQITGNTRNIFKGQKKSCWEWM